MADIQVMDELDKSIETVKVDLSHTHNIRNCRAIGGQDDRQKTHRFILRRHVEQR
jgi:hypothetical protein